MAIHKISYVLKDGSVAKRSERVKTHAASAPKRIQPPEIKRPPRSPEAAAAAAERARDREILKRPHVDPHRYMKLVVGDRCFEDIANPDCDRSGQVPSKPFTARSRTGEAMS